MFILLLLKMIAEMLLQIQVQLWSPHKRETVPSIPGFSLALRQSPSLAEGTPVHETHCHAAPVPKGLKDAATSWLVSSGFTQREAYFN